MHSITLQAYPGERPVITGRIKIAGSYFRLSGFIFTGSALNAHSALIYVSGGDHIIISNNEVKNGRMSGIYLGDTGDGSDDIKLLRNYIHNNGTTYNQDHGIYFDNGTRGIIANNLIARNYARGIQLYEDANEMLVTHNTIVENLTGIVVGGGPDSTADSNLIMNNIVAFNTRFGISTSWENAVGLGNMARRNLVFGNARRDVWLTGDLAVEEGIGSDPRFADRANGDYHLRRSSPAVDRALGAYSRPRDFDGESRPRGRAPDIGMDEYSPK